MKSFLQVRRRDLIVLAAIAGVVLVVAAYSKREIRVKRSILTEMAESIRTDFFTGLDKIEYEHVLEIDCGKMLGFIGKDWGVVRLYTRRKDESAMESFMGVEYFYQYKEPQWIQIDTARIDLPEHIAEGYEKFEEAGFRVDEEAYLRLSR